MAKLAVHPDPTDSNSLLVTNEDGERKAVSRALFSIMHLLRHTGTPSQGYAVFETTHAAAPVYFVSVTDDEEDPSMTTPSWCNAPSRHGKLFLGQWARLHSTGVIEQLPGGVLPIEEGTQARATQVKIESEIQERAAQLQQPESDIELYTRVRVALALQSLNRWNLLAKLASLQNKGEGQEQV